MNIGSRDVLVVVDVQNDFCPGGALAIADGDQVIDAIHQVSLLFEHVLLTQDWHPPGHFSFASAHAGHTPFDTIETPHGLQTLWPDHCIQGTKGAALHGSLRLDRAELILRKGYHAQVDSYSAFFENDQATPTGLGGYLRERSLSRVFLAGLAYDYCVGFSALDARKLDLAAIVIKDACRAIDLDRSSTLMEIELSEAGVSVLPGRELRGSSQHTQ